MEIASSLIRKLSIICHFRLCSQWILVSRTIFLVREMRRRLGQNSPNRVSVNITCNVQNGASFLVRETRGTTLNSTCNVYVYTIRRILSQTAPHFSYEKQAFTVSTALHGSCHAFLLVEFSDFSRFFRLNM